MGKCLLTGQRGEYVKSHIIPNALMQRTSDAPFMAVSDAAKPKKMFTGWYDRELVCRPGEDILSSFDDYAAKMLINNDFTYRKRRNKEHLTEIQGGFVPKKIYEIENIDSNKFRLFGLSLLWRAATTNLQDFREIRLRGSVLSEIRNKMISGNAGPYWEYPIRLAVFCDAQEIAKCAPMKSKKDSTIRFFLDGVVLYISSTRTTLNRKRFEPFWIGSKASTALVPCVSSLDSWHAELDEKQLKDALEKHGNFFQGFERSATNIR